MTVNKFDFWRDHSLHYLEMAFRHDRHERLQNPDGYNSRTAECGDKRSFYVFSNAAVENLQTETKTVDKALEGIGFLFDCAELKTMP
jgi:hypothetical protein